MINQALLSGDGGAFYMKIKKKSKRGLCGLSIWNLY
jgi:hypothetical protein